MLKFKSLVISYRRHQARYRRPNDSNSSRALAAGQVCFAVSEQAPRDDLEDCDFRRFGRPSCSVAKIDWDLRKGRSAAPALGE